AAESLLAAVATAVPNPASGSFILIQMQPEQIESVPGFANREGALTAALRFMYQDDSIEAGFIKAPGKHRVHFGADGVQTNLFFGRKHHGDNKVFASYDRLIVMGYVTNQSVHVFNKVWLQKQIEVQDISTAYDPEKLRDTGPHNSIACSMLEVDHRPAYCHSGVHHAEGIPSVL
ncbi:MAG TPA: hypothetical protein VFK12_07895, partial [Gammaproteobacteria bacterium]|nr:hypothetical protein [Gammaproteobacteria bacterium]